MRISFASAYRQRTNWLFAARGCRAVIANLDLFTDAYLSAILWAETDNSNDYGGYPLEDNYNQYDFSPEALRCAIDDCWRFRKENARWLKREFLLNGRDVDGQAGHDFWLTRAGHGAGYFDGDWADDAGEALTAAAKAFGEIYVEVGDDGQLYFI